jgi:two-component system NarL family sensor kinase
MVEVRRISHGLRPTLLNDLGLASAIDQIAREFTERTAIAVHTQFDSLPKIQEQASTEIFRVIQEALANVEKHSNARSVWISLLRLKGELLIQLRDDGIGFDVGSKLRQRREGLGLTNMSERIDMLGGQFRLNSKLGETSIEFRLNLDDIAE